MIYHAAGVGVIMSNGIHETQDSKAIDAFWWETFLSNCKIVVYFYVCVTYRRAKADLMDYSIKLQSV